MAMITHNWKRTKPELESRIKRRAVNSNLGTLELLLVGGVDLAGDGGDAGVLPLVGGGAVEKVLHSDLLLKQIF